MIWGQVNLKNVSKAGDTPKQSRNSALTCEIMYAMYLASHEMLMGNFGQAVLGLCVHIAQTVLVGQQWVAN
jgi:hypothetical protein